MLPTPGIRPWGQGTTRKWIRGCQQKIIDKARTHMIWRHQETPRGRQNRYAGNSMSQQEIDNKCPRGLRVSKVFPASRPMPPTSTPPHTPTHPLNRFELNLPRIGPWQCKMPRPTALRRVGGANSLSKPHSLLCQPACEHVDTLDPIWTAAITKTPNSHAAHAYIFSLGCGGGGIN